MVKNKKIISITAITVVIFMFIIGIGPMDMFSHGFFTNKIECKDILQEDYLEKISLQENDYEMSFSPTQKHFTGFEIYLVDQTEDNSGELLLTITDERGREIETIVIDLNKVKNASWYKVYVDANLDEGKIYNLKFSTQNCSISPSLQSVDGAYLSDESLNGNIIIAYAYGESTFTFQQKVIIISFLVAIWLHICSIFVNEKKRRYFETVSCISIMTLILSWNYMYNYMDNKNTLFDNYQMDSESFVNGAINADKDQIDFGDDEEDYGLGSYSNLKGTLLNAYELSYVTNNDWLDGYSRTEGKIHINYNEYTQEVIETAKYVVFSNGEQYQITNIKGTGANIEVSLDADKILTPYKNGSLDDAVFYDENGVPLQKSMLTAYKSQYGLQGKVFRQIAKIIGYEEIRENLYLLCSTMTALTFSIIVFLLAKKYNMLLAGCFYVTFWLSPWIVNFARNLYWVEFTWFIPMAIGIFCAWKVDNRKCRIISYVATFIAIAARCMCGYEYISAIMMGLIIFLIADFVTVCFKKDKRQCMLLFRTTVLIGIFALLGFVFAMCIHGSLRGEGDIILGIENIIEEDVLRRTSGADFNEFEEVYWPSFNASVWEVYLKYLRFSTEIITGLPGNLFGLLRVIPIGIFVYEIKHKKVNVELISLYILFFLSSISWLCLAKSHSYIHTHMNFVLWYFGYIQICLYIIANKIVEMFRKGQMDNREVV